MLQLNRAAGNWCFHFVNMGTYPIKSVLGYEITKSLPGFASHLYSTLDLKSHFNYTFIIVLTVTPKTHFKSGKTL